MSSFARLVWGTEMIFRQKILQIFSICGLVFVTACTDVYGRPDPVASLALGAAVGGVAGLVVGSAKSRNDGVVHHHHYRQPQFWHHRPPVFAPIPPRPRYYQHPHRHYDFTPRYRAPNRHFYYR